MLPLFTGNEDDEHHVHHPRFLRVVISHYLNILKINSYNANPDIEIL